MCNRILLNKILFILIITFSNSTSFAFKMNPFSNFNEETEKYEKKFLYPLPIHENLVIESLNMVDESLFLQSKKILQDQIVRGVRWNDDPLRSAEENQLTFLLSYEHSCMSHMRTKIKSHHDYLYRSHCGDMQYLHAMASSIDEPMNETLDKIMMWLEFTYKISSGIINTKDILRDVHNKLSKPSRELFYKHIIDNGEKYKCEYDSNGKIKDCAKVETLFSFKCAREISWKWPRIWVTHSDCLIGANIEEDLIKNIALGSALHILQDSMSDSHVTRINQYNEFCSTRKRDIGVIKYNYYNDQLSHLHSEADESFCDISEGEIDIVEVGAKLIIWSLEDRKNKTHGIMEQDNWNKVSNYLRSIVFAPANTTETSKGKYNK